MLRFFSVHTCTTEFCQITKDAGLMLASFLGGGGSTEYVASTKICVYHASTIDAQRAKYKAMKVDRSPDRES